MKHKIEKYVRDRTNILLCGPAGVGKTHIMEAVLTDIFGKDGYVVLHGATIDPYVDLIGLPYAKKEGEEDVLGFLRPKLWDGTKKAVFIDELNRAPKAVRNAVMELIQFRTINGVQTNIEFVGAAINPEDEETELGEQMYNVERLDPAQKDRFHVWLNFPNDIDDDYFADKYGTNIAAAAREFWTTADSKVRTRVGVTPRRVDYAVEIVINGGWIEDVIPTDLPGGKNLEKAIREASIGVKFLDAIKAGDVALITEFVNGKNAEAVLASAPTLKTEATCIEYLADDRIVEAISKYTWFVNGSLYTDEQMKRYKTIFKAAAISQFTGDKLKQLTIWGNVNGKLYPLTEKFTSKVKKEGWTLDQLATPCNTPKDAFYALYALKLWCESNTMNTTTFVSTAEKFIDICTDYPESVLDDGNEEALEIVINSIKQYIADNNAEELTKALKKPYRTNSLWVGLTEN